MTAVPRINILPFPKIPPPVTPSSTATSADEPLDAFVGWRRVRGGQWSVVCSAPTADACWRRLLALNRRVNLPMLDSTVLPRGRKPAAPRRSNPWRKGKRKDSDLMG
jgi:hypothetical protein